jgi:hypothetical protein
METDLLMKFAENLMEMAKEREGKWHIGVRGLRNLKIRLRWAIAAFVELGRCEFVRT